MNFTKRCFKLGQVFPNKVDYNIVATLLKKIILEENEEISEESFKKASKEFSKGFIKGSN